MGVINTILSSRDDAVKPKHKSYWGCELDIDLIDIRKIRNKKNPTTTEVRALKNEFSEKEHIKDVIKLTNNRKSKGRLTTYQLKDILSDIGFNVDVIIGEKRLADITAVMNIGGNVIPGWVRLIRKTSRFLPSSEKLFLTKLAPGKDRLHLRIYENNDGSWLVAAHTDHNWMSLNLKNLYSSHLADNGAGDYITGTIMMVKLLELFNINLNKNRIIKFKDIAKAIDQSYKESVLYKLNFKPNLLPLF